MLWKSPIDQAAEKLGVALRNAMRKHEHFDEINKFTTLNPSSLDYSIDDVKQMLIQKYGTEGLMLLEAAESQNIDILFSSHVNYSGVFGWTWGL